VKTRRRYSPLMFLAAILVGLLAGGAIIEKNMQVAEASSREQGHAAVHAARSAIDSIRNDMERAGYAETRPASHDVAVRVAHTDTLQITRAFAQTLTFRTPEGFDIVYELKDGKLIRSANGESQVLIENARDFKVQPANDGATVNLAFWIAVAQPFDSKANQAPAYAHFVRASE
jgi:hypothetical protein